ncbi:MAG: YigZ family protein [Raoultibacter sp.]
MEFYTTIRDRATAEIVEKKSRFIASVAHVETEAEALAFLEEIRATHRMARHNVYAYLLREGGRIRYSDDGEPQKTAGMPTLEVLRHAQLVDVIVVVTRYFGGVLLGTGGLVRAYTRAAQAGLAAAEVVCISRCVDVVVRLPYALYDQALRMAHTCNAQVVDTVFTDGVEVHLLMLDGEQNILITQLRELCRGQENVAVGAPHDAVF